ncbi:MAG: carbohydrate-binding domain-containing protein, partial [Clostridia bacterium]|nr:carbohydrate-binding domain-containing protein [Clostridia bacterium]
SFSTSSYNAVSDAKAFNSAYDMVQISVSSSKISFGSWSNYAASSSNSAEVSAKGIKAENEIYISGGTLDIKAYDDAIHANSDGTLENGSSPLGNVNISGGTMTLYASDDGVHADYKLTISGGYINITSSYEGPEGNLITISGGSTYVLATDDGVNATSGKSTAAITVSGGLLDVTVPSSGDTDGIDSNGTYTQTGGVVIVKGPGSASGNTMGAAALDTDGTVKVTGGTLVVFGGIEQTPSTSNVTKTLCSSSTVSTGSHTISFSSSSTTYTTKLTYSTSGCVCYSALGTATLK